MKRKWTYLGAFFPLSVAVATMAAEAASVAGDDYPNLMRAKNGTSDQDAQGDNGAGQQGGSEDVAAPQLKSPSADQSTEDVARASSSGGIDQTPSGGSPNVKIPVSSGDGSMFAPAGTAPAHSFESSGGGGGSGSSRVANTDTETPPPDDTGAVPDPVDTGPGTVVPDPEDADAMMILLGGSAEASGEGATSAGQTILDIVDYGDVTIAYGRAIYTATGEDTDADTILEVAGADVVYSYEVDNDDGNTDTSAVYVVAVDFEGDPGEHPELSNLDWLQLLLSHGPFTEWSENEDDDDIDVDGNVALFTVSAEGTEGQAPPSAQQAVNSIENAGSSALILLAGETATLTLLGESQGLDTFVSADGLLQIDDQFSSVSGVLVGIA